MKIIIINNCCGSGYKYFVPMIKYLRDHKIPYHIKKLHRNSGKTKEYLTPDEINSLKITAYLIIDGVKIKIEDWKQHIETQKNWLNNIEVK